MGDVWITAVNFKDHNGEEERVYLMILFNFRPSFKHRMFENCFSCKK